MEDPITTLQMTNEAAVNVLNEVKNKLQTINLNDCIKKDQIVSVINYIDQQLL